MRTSADSSLGAYKAPYNDRIKRQGILQQVSNREKLATTRNWYQRED